MTISRRVALALLALLSVQFVALGLVQAWRDSPTYDEKYHLSGGVTALTDHQLRLTPEHPPLPKVLAALPALAEHPVIPRGKSWKGGDGFSYPDEFLQAQLDAGKLQRVTFVSRLVPLAIAVGVGWALYALAASLFGRAAGLLAGGLWLTTPFVLGLGHLDGNDVGFTLVVVLAAWALLRYVRRQTWANAVIVGLAGGGALLVRITGLAVIPVLGLVVVLSAWPRLSTGLLRGGLVLVVAFVPLAIVLTAILLPYPEPVGVRYLLPVVALGLVAASPLVRIARRRWGVVLLGVLAAGQLAFFWQSQPHALAWTAPPFRPGYRVATDSNLDWGQDFYRLQDWSKGKKPVVLYFGPLEPVPNLPGSLPLFVPTEQEGVLGVLDPEVLRHRWLAVSATALTAYFRPVLGWLRAYCPVGNLGGTIMLYRFNRPPDYDVHGPDRPSAPCDGDVSHR